MPESAEHLRALERRINKLETARAADAQNIAWMRENLTLARSQHNWNIATIISLLGTLVAVGVALSHR